jgi:hypothetical protein
MQERFAHPPDSARPWVYWYFMDGNMTREGMTADLEAMKAAGIGGALFLEVGIGIPRGPVDFMSPEWLSLFGHAVAEADRLGIAVAVGTGPGWCGSGGPWITPDLSMQHTVMSETRVEGPSHFNAVLPRPNPRTPFFGMGTLAPDLKAHWQTFYRDAAVRLSHAGRKRPARECGRESALLSRALFLASRRETLAAAGDKRGAARAVYRARTGDGSNRQAFRRRKIGLGRTAGKLDAPARRTDADGADHPSRT